ncbi:MAG: hypothetical protein NWE98_07270 [Candidatus Bathyarchaeota archaeon]|nr:hypothetical protein [Candidatus Bathyarchaeota archaeon]
MSTPISEQGKTQEPLAVKTHIIAIGLGLAIIGSLICSAYAKDTYTNYAGFGMLLAGIASFVLGVFATAATALKMRLRQRENLGTDIPKSSLLFTGIWSVGIGIVLTVTGYLLRSSFSEYLSINYSGVGMLLAGTLVCLIGIAATMFTMLGILRAMPSQARCGPKKPFKRHFSSHLSIGIGITCAVAGSTIADSYPKESVLNYSGFGLLLVGIAVLSIGISQAVVNFLRTRWNLTEGFFDGCEPRIVLGSFWAIGIGGMLVINGSLIASSYAKSSLLNYAGFGMLLVGTGVFVYGVFETARISAMGYLGKRSHSLMERAQPMRKESLPELLRNYGRNLVKTTAIVNLAGVMTALGLLFFSLWQLDLIVSGPVWWSDGYQGWSYAGPGPYADKPFQCFLWKTTIGQAYDTLFMLIFISFIVLFASAYFWPRSKK